MGAELEVAKVEEMSGLKVVVTAAVAMEEAATAVAAMAVVTVVGAIGVAKVVEAMEMVVKAVEKAAAGWAAGWAVDSEVVDWAEVAKVVAMVAAVGTAAVAMAVGEEATEVTVEVKVEEARVGAPLAVVGLVSRAGLREGAASVVVLPAGTGAARVRAAVPRGGGVVCWVAGAALVATAVVTAAPVAMVESEEATALVEDSAVEMAGAGLGVASGVSALDHMSNNCTIEG